MSDEKMSRRMFVKSGAAGSAFAAANLVSGAEASGHTSSKPPVALEALSPASCRGDLNPGRAVNGEILNIGELVFPHGVGTSVPAKVTYSVPDGYDRFEAWIGFNITSRGGSGVFRVYVDGEAKFDSGKRTFHQFSRGGGPAVNPDRPMKVTVPVDGASELTLEVKGLGDGSELFADWADACFVPADWSEFRPRKPVKEGLGATPPMGWNNWNCLGSEISDEIIREVADALVETGLKDAGYTYLNLDAGWQADTPRNENKGPRINRQRFPDGLEPMGDYVHDKGLKFGIYARPDYVQGSRLRGMWTGGNEKKWVRAFERWGVDYLKYDFGEKLSYYHMAQALKESSRPVYYNVCEWGHGSPWNWAYYMGAHSWRITYDVMDRWYTGADQNPVGILDAVEQAEGLGPYVGPGHWNDLDMLVVGLSGGTWAERNHWDETNPANRVEHRSQMSLYCLLASPLLIGSDVRNLDDYSLETLRNREAIRINQDPMGVPAWRTVKLDEVEVWKRPLENGDVALGLLNRDDTERRITASWRDLNLEGAYRVRDVWKHTDQGKEGTKISRTVAPHETVLLRMTRSTS